MLVVLRSDALLMLLAGSIDRLKISETPHRIMFSQVSSFGVILKGTQQGFALKTHEQDFLANLCQFVLVENPDSLFFSFPNVNR